MPGETKRQKKRPDFIGSSQPSSQRLTKTMEIITVLKTILKIVKNYSKKHTKACKIRLQINT